MNFAASVRAGTAATIMRLGALHPLDPPALAAIDFATQRSRLVQPQREMLVEGQEGKEPLLVVDGWAARIRQLADGRRQIMNFILPGDLVGLSDQPRPLAASTVIALGPVIVCHAPEQGAYPALDRAYAVSRAVDEAYLYAQVTRLGRLTAHERIVDLFLELLERLTLVGRARNGAFAMPLTQEIVADALGLTSVHVNRMLQQARRAGELSWRSHEVVLHDPASLRELTGRQPPMIHPTWANVHDAEHRSRSSI